MIPFIEKKEIDWHQVEKILRNSKRLNQYANGGPAVKKLENFISQKILKKNISVSMVSSGTAALNIASNFFIIFKSINPSLSQSIILDF